MIREQDVKLERFFIKKERKSYYIGITHTRKKFKILKNNYSLKFKKNDDIYIYYIIEKKNILNTTINPISHEEYISLKEIG